MWCFGDAKSKISNACLVWNTPAHDLAVGFALDIDINLLYLINLSVYTGVDWPISLFMEKYTDSPCRVSIFHQEQSSNF